jgi:hypothetical protein
LKIKQSHRDSIYKNKDMPLKVEKKRKREDIGLDIFEVKKELGMKSIHH